MSLAGEPSILTLSETDEGLERQLESIPDAPAVFLLHAPQGEPYVARTSLLRRRLRRMLRRRQTGSGVLSLRPVVTGLEYWPVRSRLEMLLTFYETARRHFPDRYLTMCKLRMPAYLRMLTADAFPRTQITSRFSGPGRFFGPFRTRAGAEEFEHRLLDLFQLRRCREDLDPRPDHPGCIYGEMNMCARPCQQAVGPEEYASEAARVTGFLQARGATMVASLESSRDRLSSECEFEAAEREHRRLERVQEVLRLADELARDLDEQNGVAVTPGERGVRLWFLREGAWCDPQNFDTEPLPGRSRSLDSRLREVALQTGPPAVNQQTRQEHMALLARWYYSSYRDSDWIPFRDPESIPWRKVVSSVSRTANKAETRSTKPGV